jgi:hypothetical protein
MRLLAGGNFGIGTSIPGSLCQVGAATTTFYGGRSEAFSVFGPSSSPSTTTPQPLNASMVVYGTGVGVNIGGSIGFSGRAANYGQQHMLFGRISGVQGGSGNYEGDLVFETKAFNDDFYERMRIYSSGTVNIPGTLSKGAGSFDIVHPIPEKAEKGYRLRHCFVESPTRGDNLYRYTITTSNLTGYIEMPKYFNYLNENIQVFVSADFETDGYGRGRYNNNNNHVEIKVSIDGLYNILVIGTRKDQLAIDFFDNNGGVEYIKS